MSTNRIIVYISIVLLLLVNKASAQIDVDHKEKSQKNSFSAPEKLNINSNVFNDTLSTPQALKILTQTNEVSLTEEQLLSPTPCSVTVSTLGTTQPAYCGVRCIKKGILKIHAHSGGTHKTVLSKNGIYWALDCALELTPGLCGVNNDYPELNLSHIKPEQVFYYEIPASCLKGVDNNCSLNNPNGISSITVTTQPGSVSAQYLNEPHVQIRVDISFILEYEQDYFPYTIGTNFLGLPGNSKFTTCSSPPPGDPTIRSVSGNQMSLFWSLISGTFPCPEQVAGYQLQILRLYNDDITKTTERDIRTTIDWNKALTLFTEHERNSIDLTIAEGRGYYAWRVRPIFDFYTGGINNPLNYGNWSNAPSQGSSITLSECLDATTITNNNHYALFFYENFDNTRNWSYSRGFSEGDESGLKIGEGITYSNALLQPIQSQVRNFSDNTTLVKQQVYDYSGRPAVNILSTPITQGYLGFVNNAVTNTSNTLYNTATIDSPVLNSNKVSEYYVSTQPVNSSSPLGAYYTQSESNQTGVPNASNYSLEKFTVGADGKVVRVGSVGSTLALSSNSYAKNTTISYASVSDAELTSVFGDEAPRADAVSKQLVTDENGLRSVVYTDIGGKTLATCIKPYADEIDYNTSLIKAHAPNENPTQFNLTGEKVNLLQIHDEIKSSEVSNDADDRVAVLSKEYTFTEPETLSVAYDIIDDIPRFTTLWGQGSNCQEFCKTCDYKITIQVRKIRSHDGKVEKKIIQPIGNPSLVKSNFEGTNTTAVCAGDNSSFDKSATFYISEPGSYVVERIIEALNTDANGKEIVQQHIDAALNNVKPLKDIIQSLFYPPVPPNFSTLCPDPFSIPIINANLNNPNAYDTYELAKFQLKKYQQFYNSLTPEPDGTRVLSINMDTNPTDLGCRKIVLPKIGCPDYCDESNTETFLKFENYLKEQVPIKKAAPYESQNIDTYEYFYRYDGTSLVKYYTGGAIPTNVKNGFFDGLVANMRTCGYPCDYLFEAWQKVVFEYKSIRDKYISESNPVILPNEPRAKFDIDPRDPEPSGEKNEVMVCYDLYEEFFKKVGRFKCTTPSHVNILNVNDALNPYMKYKSSVDVGTLLDVLMNGHKRVVIDNQVTDDQGTLIIDQCMPIVTTALPPYGANLIPFKNNNNPSESELDLDNAPLNDPTYAEDKKRGRAVEQLYASFLSREMMKMSVSKNGAKTLKDIFRELYTEDPTADPNLLDNPQKHLKLLNEKCENTCLSRESEFRVEFVRLMAEAYQLYPLGTIRNNGSVVDSDDPDLLAEGRIDCAIDRMIIDCMAGCNLQIVNGVLTGKEQYEERMGGRARLALPTGTFSNGEVMCAPNYRPLGSKLSLMQALVNYLNEEYNQLSHYWDLDRNPEDECPFPIIQHVNFAQKACQFFTSIGMVCPACIVDNPKLNDITVYPCMYGAFSFIGGDNSTEVSEVKVCAACQLIFTQDVPCNNAQEIVDLNFWMDKNWNQKTTSTQSTSSLFNTSYLNPNLYYEMLPMENDIAPGPIPNINTRNIDAIRNNLLNTDFNMYHNYTHQLGYFQFHENGSCLNLFGNPPPAYKDINYFTAIGRTYQRNYFPTSSWPISFFNAAYEMSTFFGHEGYFRKVNTSLPQQTDLWSGLGHFLIGFPPGRLSSTTQRSYSPYFYVSFLPVFQDNFYKMTGVLLNMDYGQNSSTIDLAFRSNPPYFFYDGIQSRYYGLSSANTELDYFLDNTFTQSVGFFYLDNWGYLRFFDRINNKQFRYKYTQFGTTRKEEITCLSSLCNSEILCDGLCIRYEPVNVIQPTTPPILTTIIPDDCSMTEVAKAKLIIADRYNEIKRNIEKEIRAAYAQTCNARKPLNDKLTVEFDDQYYHYTLYYYDIAGRLIKTVSPKGVDINPTRTRASAAIHNFVSTFKYNPAGQIIEETMPDAGTTVYAYNNRGQLRAVQTQKQLAENRVSIINYDHLQRVKESKEIYAASALTPSQYFTEYSDISGSNPKDITTLTYSATTTLPAPYASLNQRNTRNNISKASFDNGDAGGSDIATSYFSYDPQGNVEWVVQQNPGLQGIKIDYSYDLISGNVNRVNYRKGYSDQLFHRYTYDRDNRLKSVQTSRDTVIWDNDISYQYYKHGPLKRVVLGEDKVQGIDYIYTLQGWLKSINHGTGSPSLDPGGDNQNVLADFNAVASDAFGMTLGYYNGDYNGLNDKFSSANGIHAPQKERYDGNITVITSKSDVTNTGLNADYFNTVSVANLYGYDKIGRLKEDLFAYNNGSNTYTRGGGSAKEYAYDSYYKYDANGNLQNLSRRSLYVNSGNVAAKQIDDFTYNYYTAGVSSNKLQQITDNAGTTPGVNDLGTHSNSINYEYYDDGSLKKDKEDNIEYEWNSKGKIRKIIKKDANNAVLFTVTFDYDSQGNKIRKYLDVQGTTANDKNTYYVYDAKGILMAIYEKTGPDGEIFLTEAPINAPGRIGSWRFGSTWMTTVTHTNTELTLEQPYNRWVDLKSYELKDQTGNIRVVIGDRKFLNSNASYAAPDIKMVSDYYPYGMAQTGRVASTGADYRYGYNGMEEEDKGSQVDMEIAQTGEKPKIGDGNLLNTEYRLYDPRVAQWLSIDPVFNPSESPYVSMGGNPIVMSDPDGDTPGTGGAIHTPDLETEGGGSNPAPSTTLPPSAKIIVAHKQSKPSSTVSTEAKGSATGAKVTAGNQTCIKATTTIENGKGEYTDTKPIEITHADPKSLITKSDLVGTALLYSSLLTGDGEGVKTASIVVGNHNDEFSDATLNNMATRTLENTQNAAQSYLVSKVVSKVISNVSSVKLSTKSKTTKQGAKPSPVPTQSQTHNVDDAELDYETYVEVYHKGTFEKGSGRPSEVEPLSTGTEFDKVSKLDRKGPVWTFRIPSHVLKKWLIDGKVRTITDQDFVTGVYNSELRFTPETAKEIFDKYQVKR